MDCRNGLPFVELNATINANSNYQFCDTRQCENGKRYRRYVQPMKHKNGIHRPYLHFTNAVIKYQQLQCQNPTGRPNNSSRFFLLLLIHLPTSLVWLAWFRMWHQFLPLMAVNRIIYTKATVEKKRNENTRQVWGWIKNIRKYLYHYYWRWVIISFYSCSPASSFISHFYGHWPCPQSYANHKFIE